MADIIPFGAKPEELQIWVCSCGSKHFVLNSDGTVECSLCMNVSASGNWHEQLEPDPKVKPEHTRQNIDHGSEEFAQRSIIKSVGPETLALIVIQQNGTIRAWADTDGGNSTPEERERLRERMQSAYNLIFGIADEPKQEEDQCQLSMEV